MLRVGEISIETRKGNEQIYRNAIVISSRSLTKYKFCSEREHIEFYIY